MPRYVGLQCPHEDRKTFIVWKEIPSGGPPATVKALDVVSGTCPKCKREYAILAEQMEERKGDAKAAPP
jgi:hypothetical protein